MTETRVTTQSGTVYVFDEGKTHVTRWVSVHHPGKMRRDGEPIKVIACSAVSEGYSMGLLLDLRGDGVLTHRTTTPVTKIEEKP